MTKLNILETSILGLLVGSAISAYITYLIGINALIGKTLEIVSLRPLLQHIVTIYGLNISNTTTLVITFVFFTLVFTIYGALIGLVFKFSSSTKYIVIGLGVIVLIVATEQIIRNKKFIPAVESQNLPALTRKSQAHTQEKYFGMEAYGDLSDDGADDIAFIISRKDVERGMLYYLVAALHSANGHDGTNLIFLGDKNKPEKISIENQTIVVELTNENGEKTNLYAHLIEGELVKIENFKEEITNPNPSR